MNFGGSTRELVKKRPAAAASSTFACDNPAAAARNRRRRRRRAKAFALAAAAREGRRPSWGSTNRSPIGRGERARTRRSGRGGGTRCVRLISSCPSYGPSGGVNEPASPAKAPATHLRSRAAAAAVTPLLLACFLVRQIAFFFFFFFYFVFFSR